MLGPVCFGLPAEKLPCSKELLRKFFASEFFGDLPSSQTLFPRGKLRSFCPDDFEAFLEDAFEVFDRATL